MTKTIRSSLLLPVLILLILSGCSAHRKTAGFQNTNAVNKYKNVIVMIPDGCSMGTQTLARYYNGSALNLDGLNSGSIKTFAANSVITDSAAAATAFATGHKTTNGFLGIGPRTDDLLTGFIPDTPPYRPVPSILEGAKHNGKATGIVVTSVISHATPAGFLAHTPGRMMYDKIMEQIVYQDVDVVFGGGAGYLLPAGESYKAGDGRTWQGARRDSENLLQTLGERGYRFISSRDDMDKLTVERVWGLFNDRDLVPDIDRDEFNPSQPSLAEMTGKAIEILSKNKNGFFLLVEGSQIDFGGHDHDPVFTVSEFLAFDKAVGRAVDYAKKDGETLVIIFPDHDTGGLTLGNYSRASENYSSMSLETLVAPLQNAEITIEGLMNLAYKDDRATREEIQELFKSKWQLSLDDARAEEILKYKRDYAAVSDYISRNFTVIGWGSSGHTGTDVPLWVYPCQRNCTFTGSIDNTGIAIEIADMMDIDLDMLGKELFVEAGEIFPDYVLSKDGTGNVLKIGKALMPVNRDVVIKDGREFRTGGITVYAPDIDSVFIPRKAVKIIQSEK